FAPVRQWRNRLTAVLLEPDLFFGDAPGNVALAKEMARGEEQVHQGKMGLDKALAHEERLRRDIGKTLMAPPWRLVDTEFLIVDGPHHLPLPVADGQVLMERVYDRHVPERVPHLPDQVVAQEQRM